MSNKSTGNLKPDRWKLTFVGGPMDGKMITHPVLPEPKFGKRDKAGVQFFYVPTEVDEVAGKAKMVLG